MDLNQTQLFAAIDRSAMMNNLEKTTRIMNYTGRVNLYSNSAKMMMLGSSIMP